MKQVIVAPRSRDGPFSFVSGNAQNVIDESLTTPRMVVGIEFRFGCGTADRPPPDGLVLKLTMAKAKGK